MLIYLKHIIQGVFQKELSFQMQSQTKANFLLSRMELLQISQKSQDSHLVVENQL